MKLVYTHYSVQNTCPELVEGLLQSFPSSRRRIYKLTNLQFFFPASLWQQRNGRNCGNGARWCSMVSKYNLKELALGVLAAGIPVITFWLWDKTLPLLLEGEYRDFIRFIMPIVGLAVSSTLFALLGIFVRTRILAYVFPIISISASFLFIPATPTVLGAYAASILLIIYAVYRMRQEYEYSLGFSVAKIVRAGLPVYFSVVALMLSMFYFSGLDEERALSAFVPRSLIQFFLDRMSGEAGFFSDLPKMDAETTVDDLLFLIAERELTKQGVPFASISKGELEKIISLQRNNLSQQFGITLSGEEKVGEAFYGAITEKIQNFFGPYKNFLPVAAAIVFFLAFKAFTWPLYFISMLLTYILIRLMVFATIVREEKVTIEVEKLVF